MNQKNNCYDDDMLSCIADEVLAPEAGLHLADPYLVSYYKDYENRVIWITKDIDMGLYVELKRIITWNREDEQNNIPIEERKPITIFIDSPGGYLDTALAFITIVEKSKTPVKTVNMSNSMSAGGLLLMCGHPGMRYCMPLSTALIHEGNGGCQGGYNAVQAQSEDYKHTMKVMKDWITKHTKIDEKTLKKWSGKETYLYAEDQLKWGLVDYIVDDITEIL